MLPVRPSQTTGVALDEEAEEEDEEEDEEEEDEEEEALPVSSSA